MKLPSPENKLLTKIIVDVNLAVRWAKVLSEQGIEAVHWTELGASNAQDIEIMTYARQNGYSVFTNDLDFSAILISTRASGPSVIQIRAEDTRPEALVKQVTDAIIKFSTAIEQGTIITIDPNKTRVHILPFVLPENE
jgi:predicted nuclease of predicted toxin-antitoxin system